MATIDNTVNIPSPAGPIWSFYAHPAGDGAFPVVVIYFDAPGMRGELQDMARRIAAEGYLCLLPDMYWRLGSLRFRISHRDAAMARVFQAARHTLTHAQVTDDMRALLDWLDRHSRARAQKIGVIGYCQGGRFVLSTAGSFPDRVTAAATLYGTEMATDRPDSPHLLANRMQCELYLGFASDDPLVPPDVIPTLEKAFAASKIPHRVETFTDTRHGFCFPERDVYNREAAETVWTRVFDLLARRIK